MIQQQNLKEYQQNTYLSNDDEELKNQVVEFSPKQRFQRFNDEIGYSFFKTVYRAYDAETGRQVYWHTINGLRISEGKRKRILKDIAILKTFNHSNILRCIDSWINQRKRQIIFITEMVNGGSLKSLLNKIKRPKLKIIKNWAVQILQGIDYLHSLLPIPFSHKNIKCENLYVNTNTNQIKIGEIGNLSIQTPDSIYSSFINLASSFQQNMDDFQGISIDIYCFGMTLLEIVTGKPAYNECANQSEVCKKILNNIKPQTLDLITNSQLRNIISLCIGELKSRPTVKELLEMNFWKTNQEADNQVIHLMQQPSIQPKQIHTETQKIFKINQMVQRKERENQIIYSFTFDNRKKFQIKITRQKREEFEECINYLNSKLQDKVLQKQDQTTGFSYQQQTKNYLCESRGKQEQVMVFKKDLESNNNEFSDEIIPIQNKIKESFTLMYQNYKNSIDGYFNHQNQQQYEEQMQQRFIIQKKQLQIFHTHQREKFKLKKKSLNGNIMNYYSPSSYNIIDILELDGEQMHNSPDTSEVDKHYTFKNIETKNIDLLDLNYSSIELKNGRDYIETNNQIKFQQLLSKDLDQKYDESKNGEDQMVIPQLIRIKSQQIYKINQINEEGSPKRDFYKIQKNDGHIFQKKIKLDEEQKETSKY